MSTVTEPRATVDDLYRVAGQAELVDGRIIRLPFHTIRVSRIVMAILNRLYDERQRTGLGAVGTSTLGYTVPRLPSGRESFCSDASYYLGPPPRNRMAFIDGPPALAVEVRDEVDNGARSPADISAKRADYFAAGTLVVWDVDPEAELIHAYRATDPERPTTFARGQTTDAEPAVPGWRIEVDAVFGAPGRGA